MITLRLHACDYTDHDNMLEAAAEDVRSEYNANDALKGYDMDPRWDGGDDGSRDHILVDLPDHVTLTASHEDLVVCPCDNRGRCHVRSWDSAASFVMSVYGASGDEPGDCSVDVGVCEHGWYHLRQSDDGWSEREPGSYRTESAARDAAVELAESLDEGGGQDAETLQRAALADAARVDSDGAWACYWETCLDNEERVVSRHASEEAACAAAQLHQIELEQTHHGHLLCGYSVRRLVAGKWHTIDE